MLGKCLFKHKRRALFYSYHLCAQESQMNKLRGLTLLPQPLRMMHVYNSLL